MWGAIPSSIQQPFFVSTYNLKNFHGRKAMAYRPTGRYFEKLEVGDEYENVSRTLTETDIPNQTENCAWPAARCLRAKKIVVQ
jgi:hypothetical protein